MPVPPTFALPPLVELVAPGVVALYYFVLGVLGLYGFHRLWLVGLYLRHRHAEPPCPAEPAVWPLVTVQLPIYNERYVVARLLDAVAALDYPRDRLYVQVLDDSTDDTSDIVARRVAAARSGGLVIEHRQRSERSGFKAGALAAGLADARGELVAIFDADFVPPPDFLRRLVPHFTDPATNERLGMVQACWEHLDRNASTLSRVQAILLDGHFRVEHTARHRSGCFFNFNGTAGIWHRAAITEAGGWQGDTLTEDLDLSYRAQLAGWHFRYLPAVTVPAELPADIDAWKAQQHRWALGSMQTARKLLGRILSAPLPLGVRLEAAVHLTNNASYLLMVLLSLLLVPALWLRREASTTVLLAVDLPLFLGATGSVLAYYAVSQCLPPRGGPRSRGRLTDLLPLLGLGIGLAVNNTRAVLAGLSGRRVAFARTPKYALAPGEEPRSRRYRAATSSLGAELSLAALFTLATAAAITTARWAALPFLLLFLSGYGRIALLGLRQARTAVRATIDSAAADPS